MQLKTMIRSQPYHQHGVTLFITLIFLAILTMISLTAMQGSILGEKIGNNEIDRNLSFQAAEAGLRDAEKDLLFIRADGVACTVANCRPSTRFPGSLDFMAAAFTANCQLGFCDAVTGGDKWQVQASWNNAVVYGTYTGATALPNVAQQPRYIVENFRRTLDGGTKAWVYRVTVRGFGSLATSQTTLQAIYILKI